MKLVSVLLEVVIKLQIHVGRINFFLKKSNNGVFWYYLA